MDIFEVPGGHDSLVREPNVRILGAGLEDVLRRDGRQAVENENVTTETRDRKVTVGV